MKIKTISRNNRSDYSILGVGDTAFNGRVTFKSEAQLLEIFKFPADAKIGDKISDQNFIYEVVSDEEE